MAEITINKICGCMKKSGIDLERKFETPEAACQEAQAICEDANETFCQKHCFSHGACETGAVITCEIREA